MIQTSTRLGRFEDHIPDYSRWQKKAMQFLPSSILDIYSWNIKTILIKKKTDHVTFQLVEDYR
jgi:hypothetical protein